MEIVNTESSTLSKLSNSRILKKSVRRSNTGSFASENWPVGKNSVNTYIYRYLSKYCMQDSEFTNNHVSNV